MGTDQCRNSKREEEGGSNNGRPGTEKHVFEQAVFDVIDRERRNLQRASAVLASLTVAYMYEQEQIDAGDIAYVARRLIDGVTDALDRVVLGRAVERHQPQQPP